jgi:hypothetical protein
LPQVIPNDQVKRYTERYFNECKTKISNHNPIAKVDMSGNHVRRQSNLCEILRRTFNIHTPTWHLDFCEYKASWVTGTNRYPITVHHTLNIGSFSQVCSRFGIRDDRLIGSFYLLPSSFFLFPTSYHLLSLLTHTHLPVTIFYLLPSLFLLLSSSF